MSAVVCGLDVHKESIYATVLDRDGQVLIQRKMLNEDIPMFLEAIIQKKLAMEVSTYIIPCTSSFSCRYTIGTATQHNEV